MRLPLDLTSERLRLVITMAFKIILSGVTGNIGAEVLQQSLSNPSISAVIALARRPLPDLASHTKLEVVVLKDFKQYPDEVVAKLAGADGCIWYPSRPSLQTNTEGAKYVQVYDHACWRPGVRA